MKDDNRVRLYAASVARLISAKDPTHAKILGQLIGDAVSAWNEQGDFGETFVFNYFASMPLARLRREQPSQNGRRTHQVRVSLEVQDVLKQIRLYVKRLMQHSITPADAFACIVSWYTDKPQPAQPTETDQLLAAILDELRIIRVTLAAQSLGCEPTSISQEWLDSAYAAAYAKAKGTIQ